MRNGDWVITAKTASGAELRLGNFTEKTATLISKALSENQRPETPDRIVQVSVTRWETYYNAWAGK